MYGYWLEPKDKSADALRRHLPTGPAWDAWSRPGKTAYKLLAALAKGFEDAWTTLYGLATELDPRTTTQYLTEWETAVGLPDPCLPATTSLADRRAQVMFRLDKRRWTTVQDWKDLATLFGYEVVITPGWEVQKPALFVYDFPMRFDIFPRLGRFRVYIDIIGVTFRGFEYGAGTSGADVGFPIPFETDTKVNAFQCLIDRIKPAHVVVVWNDNPLRNYCYAETFETSFADTFCGEALS